MFTRVFTFCAVFVFGLAGILYAQGDPPKGNISSGSGTASLATSQSQAKTAPPIARLLKAFEGVWAITEELAPDSSSPKGKTGKGEIIWRPGPGGFSLLEDYRSNQGDEQISGLGAFWWDDAAQGYHTIWCDSTNPGGCIDFKNVARWEGSNLVLQQDYEANGKKFTFKEVFSDISVTSFTQTLYGAEVGHELKVDQVIHAFRNVPTNLR